MRSFFNLLNAILFSIFLFQVTSCSSGGSYVRREYSAPLSEVVAFIRSLTIKGTYHITVTRNDNEDEKESVSSLASAIRELDSDILIDLDISAINITEIKSNTTEFEETFSYCSSLTSIILPDTLTEIGDWAFTFCSSLTSVTIPSGVTSIGKWAFCYCFVLESITIPQSVISIGSSAFRYCASLSSFKLPNSLSEVSESMLSDCISLSSIKIPESITKIGLGAFGGCTSLTSITIPQGVTEIGSTAFSDCTLLKSVVFKDVSGWKCTRSAATTPITEEISEEDIKDTSIAAEYLTETYRYYDWTKG